MGHRVLQGRCERRRRPKKFDPLTDIEINQQRGHDDLLDWACLYIYIYIACILLAVWWSSFVGICRFNPLCGCGELWACMCICTVYIYICMHGIIWITLLEGTCAILHHCALQSVTSGLLQLEAVPRPIFLRCCSQVGHQENTEKRVPRRKMFAPELVST